MAYIKKEFIERLLERADITEVIGKHCRDLKKRGVNYFCCSPFTQEKTASMAVSPTRQTFKDYSSGKSGNVVTFLMEHLQRTYPEAIAYLAQQYNMPMEYEDAEWAKAEAQKVAQLDQLRPVLHLAREQYRKAYQALPAQHPARVEAEQHRQYSEDARTEYQIGFAPGGTYLFDAFQKAGKLAEARTLGLIGDQADKYWHRVTYAINDRSGLVIGGISGNGKYE